MQDAEPLGDRQVQREQVCSAGDCGFRRRIGAARRSRAKQPRILRARFTSSTDSFTAARAGIRSQETKLVKPDAQRERDGQIEPRRWVSSVWRSSRKSSSPRQRRTPSVSSVASAASAGLTFAPARRAARRSRRRLPLPRGAASRTRFFLRRANRQICRRRQAARHLQIPARSRSCGLRAATNSSWSAVPSPQDGQQFVAAATPGFPGAPAAARLRAGLPQMWQVLSAKCGERAGPGRKPRMRL